jgi:phage terminase small subunit
MKTNAPNLRHQAFAEHIVAGKTGKDAYQLAGYAGRGSTAEVEASKLLRNPKVQSLIETARIASSSSRVATAEQIKSFWTEVMNGTIKENGLPPKLSDRIKAGELLAKTQAMFVDRTKQEGKLDITIRRGADAAASLPAGKE